MLLDSIILCFAVLSVPVEARVRNPQETVAGRPTDLLSAPVRSRVATLTITASAGPGGSITPAGAVTVAPGANQTFTIAPDPCSNIADVLVDGGSVGAVASYTFTNVQANHSISASFTASGFCCAVPDCNQAAALPPNAVGWWNPGGEGSTVGDLPSAVDMIQPEAIGTAHTSSGDVTEVNGIVGKAFLFGGAPGYTAYESVPNGPKLNFGTGEFSLEGWFYWHANTHGGRYRIVEKGQFFIGSTFEGWALMTTDQANSLHLHYGNSSSPYWSTFQLPDHEWAHLAVTVSHPTASATRIYFDMHTVSGVHKTKTVNLNFVDDVSTNRDLHFGGIPEIPGNEFTGLIDELTLYDRALSTVEIEAIYNAGCNGKRKPSPVASLSVPSVLCSGTPLVPDASGSLNATSYSWCFTPVAADCQTPVPPYGQCYAPCDCPTQNFGTPPVGRYRIDVFARNDCGSAHASACVEIRNSADPVAMLNVPALVTAGHPVDADGSSSSNATLYSWCMWPVAADCETAIPPYGICYSPCACPTWSFGVLPAGHYVIQLGVSNDCGMDMMTKCITVTEGSASSEPPADFRFLLRQNSPNPFHDETAIRFQLPSRGPVDLDVYDPAGRVQRRLVQGELGEGDHTVVWNGFDDNGRRVQAGMYFYKLRAAGKVIARKLLMVQ